MSSLFTIGKRSQGGMNAINAETKLYTMSVKPGTGYKSLPFFTPDGEIWVKTNVIIDRSSPTLHYTATLVNIV